MTLTEKSMVLGPLALVLLAMTWASTPPAPATPSTTTLLVVRHADRAGKDDALTPAGVVRSEALAHVTRNAGVSAIFCTRTVRTRKTADPLATALGLVPVELDPKDVDGLVKRVLDEHAGKTVVVVGHSNTVPAIIAACGGSKGPDLADDEFDRLFVVTVGADRSAGARVVALQYGAPSP